MKNRNITFITIIMLIILSLVIYIYKSTQFVSYKSIGNEIYSDNLEYKTYAELSNFRVLNRGEKIGITDKHEGVFEILGQPVDQFLLVKGEMMQQIYINKKEHLDLDNFSVNQIEYKNRIITENEVISKLINNIKDQSKKVNSKVLENNIESIDEIILHSNMYPGLGYSIFVHHTKDKRIFLSDNIQSYISLIDSNVYNNLINQ